MGYTHYYNTPKLIAREDWTALLMQVEKIIEFLPPDFMTKVIRGGHGNGLPKFNPDMIWFNGNEDDDLDHETFMLERKFEPAEWQKPGKKGLYFNFTKTARKPYDLLVCLVMIAMHQTVPCSLGSDGNAEDWEGALETYNKVFGTSLTFTDIVRD